MYNNYPEGSMRGSGIYSQDVDYDEFECENEECGKTNEAGTTSTDDWGRYTIECEFCGSVFDERSLEQDLDDYKADQADRDWKDRD